MSSSLLSSLRSCPLLRTSCERGAVREPVVREPTSPRSFIDYTARPSTDILSVDLRVVLREGVQYCKVRRLESAPVDLGFEIGQMRKMPHMGESALGSTVFNVLEYVIESWNRSVGHFQPE